MYVCIYIYTYLYIIYIYKIYKYIYIYIQLERLLLSNCARSVIKRHKYLIRGLCL